MNMQATNMRKVETPVGKEKQKIPNVSLYALDENERVEVFNTSELFANKSVIVISLPGAFTPTCSNQHLPRYNELASVFFKNGIDEIICIAVNDPFVMNEWKRSQSCDQVRLLADGNGEFTDKMGMWIDKSEAGLGRRARRYSMLVKNGVIDKMFVEPDKSGDPFEVSDADTMLNYVNASATIPDQVAIFTRPGCSFCARAKQLLNELKYDYVEVPLPTHDRYRVVAAVTGKNTVPQIFINGKYIGGFEELQRWSKNKSLS